MPNRSLIGKKKKTVQPQSCRIFIILEIQNNQPTLIAKHQPRLVHSLLLIQADKKSSQTYKLVTLWLYV